MHITPPKHYLSGKIEAPTSLLDAGAQKWALANLPCPINVCLAITAKFYSKRVPLGSITHQNNFTVTCAVLLDLMPLKSNSDIGHYSLVGTLESICVRLYLAQSAPTKHKVMILISIPNRSPGGSKLSSM